MLVTFSADVYPGTRSLDAVVRIENNLQSGNLPENIGKGAVAKAGRMII